MPDRPTAPVSVPFPAARVVGLGAALVVMMGLGASLAAAGPAGTGPAAGGDDSLLADLQTRQSQQKREDIADIAQPWTVQFEPSVWYAAPGGKVRMPGEPVGSHRKRLELVNLDSPRLSPLGEVHLRTGEWRFSVLGFGSSQSDRGSDYSRDDWIGGDFVEEGERISASLDFSAASFNVGYRIPIPDSLVGKGGREFRGSLEAVGGIRLYSVDFEFQTPEGFVSHDEFLAEPLAGLKYTMEIREKFNIDVQATIGAFDDGGHRSSFSYDIMAGFTYRPVENVGIQIGYRQLAFDLTTGSGVDEFRYDGALAGLFGGVVVRF